MKLIVQIPCYNERETLPLTLAAIPRHIEGIDEVEILVIDDGSTDGTSEVARRLGVEHIVRHKVNRGLAKTFKHGIDTCLRLGADVIVNTDGDNQYGGDQIPRLLEPILKGEADVVIGDRQAAKNPHFSPFKKILQRLGSFVVGHLSKTHVPDAVSGFRALSRAAALETNIVSPFSYTIEMLIQAGQRRLAVVSVPIETNAPTRPSRLFRSVPQFLRNSLTTIVRIYTMYHPFQHHELPCAQVRRDAPRRLLDKPQIGIARGGEGVGTQIRIAPHAVSGIRSLKYRMGGPKGYM